MTNAPRGSATGSTASGASPVGTPSRGALVVPLESLDRSSVQLAGGKGANLGELLLAGLPVPVGFVATVEAYDRFVAHNGLAEMIARAFDRPAGTARDPQPSDTRTAQEDRADVDTQGAAVREAFQGAAIPSEVAVRLLAAYRDLGQGKVAVRSSAPSEDQPEAAFAGQHDTFLNVGGEEALLDAVRRCWASLWTDRAIAYRRRLGLEQVPAGLAVVVQRMVAAEAAGVMFTADPVTGARDVVVIESNPGLGEAVVAGTATPDRFVLKKGSGRLKERRTGGREVVLRARPEGGIEQQGGQAVGEAPAIPARVLRRLAHLAETIERRFGWPQDVEWAWDGQGVSILQARPMTALPVAVSRRLRFQRLRFGLLAELLPIRPYPLDVTTWGTAAIQAIGPVFTLVGLAPPHLGDVLVEEDGVVVRTRGPFRLRPTPSLLLAPARVLRLALRYDPLEWQADPLLAEVRSRCRALEARDLRELPWSGLFATLDEALTVPAAMGQLRRRYLPRAALAAGLLRLAVALLAREDRFMVLLSGVETKTLEANRALEAMAGRVRADPALLDIFTSHDADELSTSLSGHPAGETLLAELRTFLDSYGHREGAVLLVSQPTWKDAPEDVLGILKGLSAAPPPSPSPTGRAAWEAAREELLTHPLLRLRPLRAMLLGLLAQARRVLQIREDTHFYATLPLPVVRRTLLELGGRLCSSGLLGTAEDVFHLRRSEIEQLGETQPPHPPIATELSTLVLRRKKKRSDLEATPLHDAALIRPVLQRPGTVPGGAGVSRAANGAGDVYSPVHGDVLVRGTPGSPGVAEGPVRVVRRAGEFHKLRPSEVLVAPYTNPSWTPLFQRAVAVVVDSGGAASHAAIVAREYGIPAVMGAGDATQRLPDGQWIRVDGRSGVVMAVRPRPQRVEGWQPDS